MTDVVHRASEYLSLMAALTRPDDLYFRSFASDGVPGLDELCDAARTMAHGGEGAVASLVIAPGDADAFHVNGTHARATLRLCPTPNTRLVVIAVLLAVLLVVFVVFRRR